MREDTSHPGQDFFIEVTLAGGRWHLDRDDRRAGPAEPPIEVSTVVTEKFLDDSRLSHARGSEDDQTRHTISWRIVDKVGQLLEDALCARILNPSLLSNPGDALLCAQFRQYARGCLEVIETGGHSRCQDLDRKRLQVAWFGGFCSHLDVRWRYHLLRRPFSAPPLLRTLRGFSTSRRCSLMAAKMLDSV